MQTAESIRKILERRGLSQTTLAELIGVDRSFLTKCINGEREPGRLSCLLLAGLCDNAEEHAFWIRKSGLGTKQATLLARALFPKEGGAVDTFEAELLDWWRHPNNPMEDSVKSVVEKVLAARTPKT